jgi:hypothetical protein
LDSGHKEGEERFLHRSDLVWLSGSEEGKECFCFVDIPVCEQCKEVILAGRWRTWHGVSDSRLDEESFYVKGRPGRSFKDSVG